MTERESQFLDAARAWSLLIVLSGHILQIFILPYWDMNHALQNLPVASYVIKHAATYAVMIFFSISGFLIYYSFVANIKRFGYFRIKYYIAGRFLRIYPPLFVCIMMTILFHFLLTLSGIDEKETFTDGNEFYVARDKLGISLRDLLGAGLLVNTLISGFDSPVLNGPLWSIAHEFWFYIISIPFMWLILKHWVLASAYFAFIYYLYLCLCIDEWWFYGWCVWLAAFVMAHINRTTSENFFYIVTFVCAGLALWGWWYFLNNLSDTYYGYRSYYPGGLLFSVLLPLILRSLKKREKQSYYSVAMSKVAGFSYSAYLIHFPIFLMIFVYTNLLVSEWYGRLFVIIGALIVTLILASVMAFYLEDKQRIKLLTNKIG